MEVSLKVLRSANSHREVNLTDELDVSAADIDKRVGERLRILRTARGLTRKQLASEIGICPQQIQKYERGTNRIAAGRLWEISRVLSVDLNDLFFGASSKIDGAEDEQHDVLEVALALRAIKNPKVREGLITLINSCARDEADKS